MCKENCDTCLEDDSCCNGSYSPLVESFRYDCKHARDCIDSMEVFYIYGNIPTYCRDCVFYESKE